MMTLDETMIINNMTNVVKNLEQSKRICDIIDDLNKLILTLRGCEHDTTDEPVKTVTVTPVHMTAETTVTILKEVPVSPPRSVAAPRAAAGPMVGSLSESPRPAAAAGPPSSPAAGPPSESKPVQKQAKAKTVTKAPAPSMRADDMQCGYIET